MSEFGKRQAQAAAEALRDMPLAAVFSSPLVRAQQTAHILLTGRPDVPLYTSDLLNEVRFFFEGQPLITMLSRNWDLYTGVDDPVFEQPPAVVARAREFLAQVRREYAGQHVVAVSHGDVIAFAALWAFGVELIPANKHTLNAHGLDDDYPAPASLLTFSYAPDANERPTTITYRRPYGEELADNGVSPK